MATKSNPESEKQASQQQAVAQPAPDVNQVLAKWTELLETQNRLLEVRIQSQTPNRFRGTAAEVAVNTYYNVVAGLQLRPTPEAPQNLEATAISPTEIELKWDWPDKANNADGFKIYRCQGSGCENFVEIESKVSISKKSYVDRGLSGGEIYRYRMSAFKFPLESAFSNIAEAKTKTQS
jgi:hypothetical protein